MLHISCLAISTEEKNKKNKFQSRHTREQVGRQIGQDEERAIQIPEEWRKRKKEFVMQRMHVRARSVQSKMTETTTKPRREHMNTQLTI